MPICRYCGREFEGRTNASFCSDWCRRADKGIRKQDADMVMAKYRTPEHEEALNRGVDYGRIQMRKTLAMIPKVQV